jgi:hypothetical protein
MMLIVPAAPATPPETGRVDHVDAALGQLPRDLAGFAGHAAGLVDHELAGREAFGQSAGPKTSWRTSELRGRHSRITSHLRASSAAEGAADAPRFSKRRPMPRC